MFDELQGFKRFFLESELAPVNREAGITELARLERGHEIFALQTDHKMAGYFMNGHLMRASFLKSLPTDPTDIEKKLTKLNAEADTLLVICVPKRWEKQLGRGTIQKVFADMIATGGSAQYVWGAYSLWNPRLEDLDEGHFYRNPNYHANDGLLDSWLKDHPSPVKAKPAVPLNRQPRIMGYHLLDQGRHSFHGYNEPELSQTNNPA